MVTKTKTKKEETLNVTVPGGHIEMLRHVKLEDLHPNPYQPESRHQVDGETARKFGLSIFEHGLLQTPVVRHILGEGATSQEQVVNGHYEVGDGWLRLAGFKYLADKGNQEFEIMPVMVRELTDQQMADLVMEANTVRQDLAPLDLAKFYKRYLEDFGVTQAELAERHSCSQGEIANTIRLLELPGDIQAKIISREISETHGRQLLRLNTRPELQAKVLKDAIEGHESVTEIDRRVNEITWRESRCLDPQAEPYEHPPVFDLNGCKDCQHKTKATDPWGRNKKEDRCLNSECWEGKQQAAKQELIDKAWAEMKDKGDAAKIMTSDQLSYNEYESLENYKRDLDNPAECDQCVKTALFKYHVTDRDEPEKICMDPACYRKKKTKRTRDANIIRKQEDKALTAKLGEAFGHVQEHPRECLLLLARKEVGALSAAGRADLLIMFNGLPVVSNGRLDLERTQAILETKTFEELLQLAMAAYITNRRRNSWEQYSTRLEKNVAADFALITENIAGELGAAREEEEFTRIAHEMTTPQDAEEAADTEILEVPAAEFAATANAEFKKFIDCSWCGKNFLGEFKRDKEVKDVKDTEHWRAECPECGGITHISNRRWDGMVGIKKNKPEKLPKLCSFENATLGATCSHYKQGKTPKNCLGYETECTNYPAPDGASTISWFHCKHLPLDRWPRVALEHREHKEGSDGQDEKESA